MSSSSPILRVAIYLRVSSDEQTLGFSLDAQERACLEWVAAKGALLITIYKDAGYSARTDNRPQFRRMVADAQNHAFDIILVHKFDRFARNRRDSAVYKSLLHEVGVTVCSVSEPLDHNDPAAVLTEGILESMAEWYSINLSRETAKGKKERALKGLHNNTVPFGYHKPTGQGPVVQPDTAGTLPGYLLIKEKALGGVPDREIAWALNTAGYRTSKNALFSKDTVAQIIKSRFYLGEVCYKKRWYPGQHPAVIEEAEWARMQKLRAARNVRPDKANVTAKRVYPLTTVLYCAACGCGMRSGYSSTSDRRYYRDMGRERGIQCAQKSVHADALEQQVGALVAQLHLPSDWRTQALERLGQNAVDVQHAEAERRKLEGEAERAKRLYIAGDLSENEYQLERVRIRTSLANLVIPDLPDLTAAAKLLSNFSAVWAVATLEERKKLVRALIARAWVKDDQLVGIELKADAYYLLDNEQQTGLVGSALD